MERAFAYLREVGPGKIVEQELSEQLSAIESQAARQGFMIVHAYQDEGEDGSRQITSRHGWNEMMLAMYSGDVCVVFVQKLASLSAAEVWQEVVIADFKRHNFRLVSVNEPNLLVTDFARMGIKFILESGASYEQSQIPVRLHGARLRAKANAGRSEGKKPYGFFRGEQDVIVRMCELRASGLGYDRIAAQMNADAISTRTGKPWHGVVVNRILKTWTKRFPAHKTLNSEWDLKAKQEIRKFLDTAVDLRNSGSALITTNHSTRSSKAEKAGMDLNMRKNSRRG
jgi:DNA invertase Pin-like site-specific DNA recombinase